VICDSYVRPQTLVRVCDECNYGSYQGRCVICGGPGVSDAYYCKECTQMEKDVTALSPFFFFLLQWWRAYLTPFLSFSLQRDGCPKIINLGSAKIDMYYDKKKYGLHGTQG